MEDSDSAHFLEDWSEKLSDFQLQMNLESGLVNFGFLLILAMVMVTSL